ncbi:hypothetical protein LUZ60_001251 [Juncus effusus]|nr:hypothetical protein LUZ60_001251 [Juncus effusus]
MVNFSKYVFNSFPPIFKYLMFLLLSFFLYLLTNEWSNAWPSNPLLLPKLTPHLNVSNSDSDQEESTKPVDVSTGLDLEIQYDFPPFLRLYKSGRVERLLGTALVPSSAFATPKVLCKDVIIDEKTGLAARLYMPNFTHIDSPTINKKKLSILIYVHGGAFVVESAFSPTYQRYLTKLVSKGRLLVVSVNYRLAPENTLPTAYDDTWQAVKWVVQNAKSGPEKFLSQHGDLNRIFMAGDSAGGNIAHNTVMRAGKEGLHKYNNGMRIKGLVLMNPYFWGKEPLKDEKRDKETIQRLESTWGFVCGWKYNINHPFVNPLSLRDKWKKLGCERVLVTISEYDLFRPRGKAYVEGLRESGWNGLVEVYETKGENHVYFLWKPNEEKAEKEMEMVISFLNRP